MLTLPWRKGMMNTYLVFLSLLLLLLLAAFLLVSCFGIEVRLL